MDLGTYGSASMCTLPRPRINLIANGFMETDHMEAEHASSDKSKHGQIFRRGFNGIHQNRMLDIAFCGLQYSVVQTWASDTRVHLRDVGRPSAALAIATRRRQLLGSLSMPASPTRKGTEVSVRVPLISGFIYPFLPRLSAAVRYSLFAVTVTQSVSTFP
ncbi:hypothetical protein G7K_3733-t1 [Saitoella complicata NRRL Y-17804]|uniref:Uncharacterized protein n=1 Tax=Saitoella complicata (strain BCRC 22490 / CBS 7301 / JCM 7358 / NBRC 10748 / NRRL Y-17804) TaxID=698492 RepID=A0A0E9NIB1_SAICN|nr:hypothetical protein G7K_3733-t1 [Saitoella complicata NRRL Y-17804]